MGYRYRLHVRRQAPVLILAILAASFVPAAVYGDEPGRGLTGPYEVQFLKSTIDHHFAALRITELAAGTDAVRESAITPNEGTAQTPNFIPTEAKATQDNIKSLARRNNRMQREEILTAQRFLREWYGIDYTPKVEPVNQARIDLLEAAAPGEQFNHLFLEVLSRHHFVITVRAAECLTSVELTHDELSRYCRSILESQLVDIADMRHMLCEQVEICDYQPVSGIKGIHTADNGEIDARYDKRFRKVTKDEDEDGEDHNHP